MNSRPSDPSSRGTSRWKRIARFSTLARHAFGPADGFDANVGDDGRAILAFYGCAAEVDEAPTPYMKAWRLQPLEEALDDPRVRARAINHGALQELVDRVRALRGQFPLHDGDTHPTPLINGPRELRWFESAVDSYAAMWKEVGDQLNDDDCVVTDTSVDEETGELWARIEYSGSGSAVAFIEPRFPLHCMEFWDEIVPNAAQTAELRFKILMIISALTEDREDPALIRTLAPAQLLGVLDYERSFSIPPPRAPAAWRPGFTPDDVQIERLQRILVAHFRRHPRSDLVAQELTTADAPELAALALVDVSALVVEALGPRVVNPRSWDEIYAWARMVNRSTGRYELLDSFDELRGAVRLELTVSPSNTEWRLRDLIERLDHMAEPLDSRAPVNPSR